MDGKSEHVDLVVVGAGWYGLATAKTYLELHPNASLVVLDRSPNIGGVWTPERSYPGLKSNNMLGTYEYSDFPMDEETFGVRPGEHIPGKTLHKYLAAYAQHFGIYQRTRLNSRVESAEEDQETAEWKLLVTDTTTGESSPLYTRNLVVATGLTSEPNLPSFVGQESFAGPLFHIKDFGSHEETLQSARSVVVMGGAKSAWDAAYAYATAGIAVHMVIRPSGRGPTWMAPPYVTPAKKWLEKLVHTRMLQWLSPCIWGDEDGYSSVRGFLHGSWLGRKMVDSFWGILTGDVVALNQYDKHPETKKLQPWHPAFWIGSGLSILNYPTDFFELVRNGAIRVHHAEITHLSAKKVHLDSGDELDADVLLCATGWKSRPPLSFLPDTRLAELGMPHHSPDPDPLADRADATILSTLPRLRDQPDINAPVRTDDGSAKPTNKSFKLYRFIAPPATIERHNIAFAGMMSSISTAICAQAQGLWISAYLDGSLDRVPERAEAEWTATLHSRFGAWRYPLGYGARVPDFVFDAVPYIDSLLSDVGVNKHRKGGIKEVLEPYGPEDYKGIVSEWSKGHAKAE